MTESLYFILSVVALLQPALGLHVPLAERQWGLYFSGGGDARRDACVTDGSARGPLPLCRRRGPPRPPVAGVSPPSRPPRHLAISATTHSSASPPSHAHSHHARLWSHRSRYSGSGSLAILCLQFFQADARPGADPIPPHGARQPAPLRVSPSALPASRFAHLPRFP